MESFAEIPVRIVESFTWKGMVMASIKPGISPCLTTILRLPGGIEVTVPVALKVLDCCPEDSLTFSSVSFSSLPVDFSFELHDTDSTKQSDSMNRVKSCFITVG